MEPPSPRPAERCRLALLLAFIAAVYLLALALRFGVYRPPYMATDNEANQYLPVSLLTTGDLYLDEYMPPDATARSYTLLKLRGHYVAIHPLGNALLALPAYAVLAPFVADLRPVAWILWRLMAVLYTVAGLAALGALATRWLMGTRLVLALALLALGTPLLSTASQDLFANTAVFFLNGVILWRLARERMKPGWLTVSLLGFAILCRPTSWATFFLVIAYSWWVTRENRSWLRAALVVALVMAAGALLNHHLTGHPLHSPYYHIVMTQGLWGGNPALNFLGFWLSPAFGVLWFAPFGLVMLWACLCQLTAWRRLPPLVRLALVLFFFQVALYVAFRCWYGGYSYGPRFLIDMLPFGFTAMLPWLGERRGGTRLRACAVLMLAYSFVVQFTGAVHFDGQWNAVHDRWSNDLGWTWDWRDPPLGYYLPRWWRG